MLNSNFTNFLFRDGRIEQNSTERAAASAVTIIQGIIGSGNLDYTPAFSTSVQNAYTDLKSWMRSEQDNDRGYRSAVSRGLPVFNSIGNLNVSRGNRYRVPELEKLITEPGDVRNQFARLVSRNMMMNRNQTTHQYQLIITYERIMYERDRILSSLVRLLTNLSSKKRPYN